jgi:integrase
MTCAETTLPALFDAYIGKLERRGRKEATIVSVRGALARFTQWIEEQGIDVDDVTGDHVFRYFKQSGYKTNTIRLHATKLKAAYDFGLRTKRTEANPFDEDEGFAVPQEERPDVAAKLIPSSDLRSMRHKCEFMMGQNALTLFTLAAYTGMRSDEMRTLEWSDVNWDDETIRVRSVNAKHGKARTIPMHPELVDVLRRVRPERPRGCILTPVYEVERLNGGTYTVVGGRGTKKAGDPYSPGTAFERLLKSFAPECGFHHFRKTVANSLYKNGVQDAVVKAILGWAPKGVMESYYLHVGTEQGRQAILRLYEDDPI